VKLEDLKNKAIAWEKNADTKEKILVVVLVNLLIVFFFYKLYYSPKVENLSKMKKEVEINKLLIIKYRSLLPRYSILKKKLEKRREFLKLINNIFPKIKDIPGLLQEIAKSAKKNELEVFYFEPKPEVEKDYYKIIPFQISLRGDFLGFLSFLNQVSLLSRLVTLHDLDVRLLSKNEVAVLATFYTFQYTGKKLKKKKRRRP